MDLPLREMLRRHRLAAAGVIHVGAHDGCEAHEYLAAGLRDQVWIEPQPDAFDRLKRATSDIAGARCFNVACGPTPGEAEMHLLAGNEGRSSSLLPPAIHLERFPDITPAGTIRVPVVPLDDLLAREGVEPAHHPLLVLDVQGYELPVLRGAPRYLAQHCRAIVSEVAAVELYKGGALVRELDDFLARARFVRVRTKWASGVGGDALYIRTDHLRSIDRVRATLGLSPGHTPPRREVQRWSRPNQ